MRKTTTATKGETQVNVRIDAKLRRQLEAVARKNFRSLTAEATARLSRSLKSELEAAE